MSDVAVMEPLHVEFDNWLLRTKPWLRGFIGKGVHQRFPTDDDAVIAIMTPTAHTTRRRACLACIGGRHNQVFVRTGGWRVQESVYSLELADVAPVAARQSRDEVLAGKEANVAGRKYH